MTDLITSSIIMITCYQLLPSSVYIFIQNTRWIMAAVWLWLGSFVVSNHLKDHVCMCLRSVWQVIYSKLLCNHMLKSFGLIRVWNELYLWHCDPYSLLNLDLLFMFFCWPVFLRNLYPQKTAGWSAAVHTLTVMVTRVFPSLANLIPGRLWTWLKTQRFPAPQLLFAFTLQLC